MAKITPQHRDDEPETEFQAKLGPYFAWDGTPLKPAPQLDGKELEAKLRSIRLHLN